MRERILLNPVTKTLRAEATALGGLATALEPRNETWGPGGPLIGRAFGLGSQGKACVVSSRFGFGLGRLLCLRVISEPGISCLLPEPPLMTGGQVTTKTATN